MYGSGVASNDKISTAVFEKLIQKLNRRDTQTHSQTNADPITILSLLLGRKLV
jgi:hypothetical protein